MSAVVIDLPFPAKILWPNGRTRQWGAKYRVGKAHREWARLAALAAGVKRLGTEGGFSVAVTVHPKTRNLIDADNAVASTKNYLDGIADALGVDDRTFETPTISFGEPVKGGRMTLTVSPHSRTGV